MVPFNVVENLEFRRMINIMDPRMPLISQRTVQRVVDSSMDTLNKQIA